MKKYGNVSLGFTEECIFVTIKNDVNVAALPASPTKKDLGEDAVIIKKINIKSMKVLQDNKFSVIIEAKGLGDDIGIIAETQERQNELLESIEKYLGKKLVSTEKELSVFKKIFGSLFFITATSIITYLLHFAAEQAISNGEVLASEYSKKKGMLASLADSLGPTGVLIIGGAIVTALVFRAIKKAKTSITIKEIEFQ